MEKRIRKILLSVTAFMFQLNENLKEEEIQLDLIMGPGLSLFGDVLWDQTTVRKERKL
jgi:hypothetical protein